MGTIIDHLVSLNLAPANKAIAITGVKLNGCGINLKIKATTTRNATKNLDEEKCNFSMV